MNNWKSVGSVFGLATTAFLYYVYKKSRRSVTINAHTEIHDFVLQEQINEEQQQVEQVSTKEEQNDNVNNDITYEDITYISDREKQILDRVIREVIEDKKKEELEFLAYIVKNALSYC